MGADMADVNNDGKADIFVTDMLPESDNVWKTQILRIMIYFLENKSGFFNQYMQTPYRLIME
jgi:hypothetical protein